jgi:DNA-binding NarL/FixJ family response regulator
MTTPTRVLVADDHAGFRRAARIAVEATPGLELAGAAASGEAAVALTASLEPDVVLLDVYMPGIGGLEAARRIACSGSGALIVLVSLDRARDLPEEARSCGATAYVHKRDFGPAALVALLRQVEQYRLDAPVDVLLPGDAELGEDRVHVFLD